MGRYLVRRLLWMPIVLLTISLITFVLMHNVPGGPWDTEKRLAPSVVENLNRRYNLDKPAWQQFILFLGSAVRGDLGVSFSNQDRPVAGIIHDGFPVSATLGIAALAIALTVGIGLGTLSALRQGSSADYPALA